MNRVADSLSIWRKRRDVVLIYIAKIQSNFLQVDCQGTSMTLHHLCCENPAVTVGFLITKHVTKKQIVYYFLAEILGAVLGSLFVMYLIDREANLGANPPSYAYPLPTIFGIEVLASALLMAVIVMVIYTKGLIGYGG